ncbi:MAG: UDP-N-acetylmuramoyl-tripeptide--D-alanyl-D-alanine ligase [Velocimicrobium sp.]
MKPIYIKEIVKSVGGTLLCGNENEVVTCVSTNSKKICKGALFVPIIGERVDAHQFIEGAFLLGAKATFTSKQAIPMDCIGEEIYIYVKDTKRALQDFAAYYRSLFTLPVIGITGSVGKTTTKEMVAAALETTYTVLKTAGNMNSQIGLALMMFEIDDTTEIAVIEMGMSEEGEMNRLSQIAKPETVVMTNIGVSHIGHLGSKENIRNEKLNSINEMKQGGSLYLNQEDILLKEVGKVDTIKASALTKTVLSKVNCRYYGLDETADAYAKDIETKGYETEFTYVDGIEEESVILSVLGIHNVGNAVAALMVAKQYNVEPGVAKLGLRTYAPIAMRGQIYDENGIIIIDDTYNASPDSIKSGMDVLLELNGIKRKIAVLADILELGALSFDCHFEIGESLASNNTDKKIEVLVTIGKEAKAIANGAKSKKTSMCIKSFEDNKSAIAYLKSMVREGDALFIKGSRGMQLEQVVDALRETCKNGWNPSCK